VCKVKAQVNDETNWSLSLDGSREGDHLSKRRCKGAQERKREVKLNKGGTNEDVEQGAPFVMRLEKRKPDRLFPTKK